MFGYNIEGTIPASCEKAFKLQGPSAFSCVLRRLLHGIQQCWVNGTLDAEQLEFQGIVIPVAFPTMIGVFLYAAVLVWTATQEDMVTRSEEEAIEVKGDSSLVNEDPANVNRTTETSVRPGMAGVFLVLAKSIFMAFSVRTTIP
jgi:hypothetical protein